MTYGETARSTDLPIRERLAEAAQAGEVGLLVEDMVWSVIAPLQAANPELAAFVIQKVAPNIDRLANAIRSCGGPVVWVGPSGTSDGADHDDLIEGLKSDPGDYSIRRDSESAFWHSNADAILRNRGVGCVIVAGWRTNYAVLVDAVDASHRGYNATIIADACAAESTREHSAALTSHPEQLTVLSTSALLDAVTAHSRTSGESE